MCVVGPRPLMVQYLSRYNERQARRHEVRPGFTGLAQVHGRRDISFNERRVLDVYYVQNWSPALDIQIFLRTIAAVLKRDGAK